MKMLQLFGVVVAIHLVIGLAVIALPGCRSGGNSQNATAGTTDGPQPATDNTSAVASLTPVSTTNNTTGAPVRFAPSRPAAQSSDATLLPIDHQVTPLTPAALAPVAPATLAPVAPVAETTPQPAAAPASTYTVQKGDSLWTIARKHGISTGELALANNLSDKAVLRIGQKLIVPSRTASAASAALANSQASTALSPIRTNGGTYTVVSGDTLGGIARKHGVKLADLRAANKLKGDSLRIGQVLTLPSNTGATAITATPTAATTTITHTVVAGDTLGNIAKQYHVAVGDIATANNITDPTKLRIGQEIRIPGVRTDSAPPPAAMQPVAKSTPAPAPTTTPAPAPITPMPASTAPVTLTPDDPLFNPGTASQPPVELTPAPVQLVPADGNY